MAHLEVEINDNRIKVRSQSFCVECLNVGKNKKAILVLLRSLCSPETGKPLFTYQQIADACQRPPHDGLGLGSSHYTSAPSSVLRRRN